MRRQDREVTDFKEIENILSESKVIHTAIMDGDFPYVVPTNYGYEFDEQHRLTIYLHGAPEGKKRDLISQNGNVGFQIDNGGRLMLPKTDDPGDHSFAYRSIIGTGKAVLVDDRATKKHALELLLVHETGHTWDNIKEHDLEYVGVIRIDVFNYTAKEHNEFK